MLSFTFGSSIKSIIHTTCIFSIQYITSLGYLHSFTINQTPCVLVFIYFVPQSLIMSLYVALLFYLEYLAYSVHNVLHETLLSHRINITYSLCSYNLLHAMIFSYISIFHKKRKLQVRMRIIM